MHDVQRWLRAVASIGARPDADNRVEPKPSLAQVRVWWVMARSDYGYASRRESIQRCCAVRPTHSARGPRKVSQCVDGQSREAQALHHERMHLGASGRQQAPGSTLRSEVGELELRLRTPASTAHEGTAGTRHGLTQIRCSKWRQARRGTATRPEPESVQVLHINCTSILAPVARLRSVCITPQALVSLACPTTGVAA